MKQAFSDNDQPGNSRSRGRCHWPYYGLVGILMGVLVTLVVLYPAALRFVELAATEARYLWWLILMVILGVWLIWGFRKSKG